MEPVRYVFNVTDIKSHFIQLKRVYGKLLVVNLLGSKKGEFALSTAFQSALKSSSHFDVKIVSFDYHAEVKQSKENLRFLVKQISSFFDENDFFYLDDGIVLRRQHGVIRTNCLDNLDRTNSVQTLIGIRALFNQLTCLGVEKFKSNIILRCEELVRDMWQKNGDQCSLIYAGTGALEGKSKLRDASRSIVRTIQNNLMDSSKQEAFDLILYGHLLADFNFVKISQIFPSSLLKATSYFYECPNLEAFVEREKEFCVQIPLKIFCGTWNVNGGKNLNNVAFKGGNLLNSWIFPENLFNKEALNYDLIAIGFEEIVDLNTNNLVKASTTNQRIWRDGLKQTIEIWQKNNFGSNAKNFVVLCCEQLVGLGCLAEGFSDL
uniref:Phosphatidylinositol-3-phosphatase SAC1 n=1 Tax=Meloidogyne floridensis TaxID=298350 RepID=A0A915NRU0_9BILA